MHRYPRHIARSLRALRNAHKLGLLHGVRIVPGAQACSGAEAQRGTRYLIGALPRLPLADCECDRCECAYLPIGSAKLHRLNVNGKRPRAKPETPDI